MEAHRACRVLEVVEVRLVELVVFLGRDLRLVALPNGHHGVDGLDGLVLFPFGLCVLGCIGRQRLLALFRYQHANGVAHVVAVMQNQMTQTLFGQEFVVILFGRAFLDGQNDVGTVRFALGRLNGVALHAVAFPSVRLIASECAGHNAHVVGHHKRRVETNAELANNVNVGTLLLSVFGLERLAVGVSDGAQVLVQLVLAHANAVIGNNNSARALVEVHANAQLVFVNGGRFVGQALEVQLVHGIGRVRNELTKEDLFIRVNGVDH